MKYELQKRAERERETRQRIVEAAVELHGELGPSRTSILALSRHAGVSRPTIYRHFPDQRALLDACSSHVRALSPPPDIAAWEPIKNPERRLTTALEHVFAYYAANEEMIAHVVRDAEDDPLVHDVSEGRRSYARDATSVLANAWNVSGPRKRRLRAAIAHSLAFSTWRSLVRDQRLANREAITLLTKLVRSATD